MALVMCCLLDWPWSSMAFVSVRSKCPLVYIMATAQRFRLTPRVVGSFDQRAAPVTTPRIPLYADVARAIDTGLKFEKKCSTTYFHEIFPWNWFHEKKKFQICHIFFSKFYGKVGVISWFLFHLIWQNYILYWDFDLKSWIVDFFTCFTQEKTPQNNFSSQSFSVENNYFCRRIEKWCL